MMNLSRHPGRALVLVTFLCAKVHFHGGVSPGVQDLPGNDADNRHPENEKREKKNLFYCNVRKEIHFQNTFRNTVEGDEKQHDFRRIHSANQSLLQTTVFSHAHTAAAVPESGCSKVNYASVGNYFHPHELPLVEF